MIGCDECDPSFGCFSGKGPCQKQRVREHDEREHDEAMGKLHGHTQPSPAPRLPDFALGPDLLKALDVGPEPPPCGCYESEWLRKVIRRMAALKIPAPMYRCAVTRCPGYPYRASDIAHPCREPLPEPPPPPHVKLRELERIDVANVVEDTLAIVKKWIESTALRLRHDDCDRGELRLHAMDPGWDDDETAMLTIQVEERLNREEIQGRVEGVK